MNDTLAVFGYRRPGEAAELTPLATALKAEAAEGRRRIANGEDAAAVGDELEEQFYLAQERARTAIEEKIRVHEKRWRADRDPIKELTNLNRWQAQFAAMDEAGLAAEIAKYTADPKGADPDRMDCLLAAAVKAGHDETGSLRHEMKANRYSEPWLVDCPELVAMHDLNSAPYGQVRVFSPYGQGDWPVRELLDDTGDE